MMTFQRDAHRGYRVGTVGEQEQVDHDDADALREVRDRRGDADGEGCSRPPGRDRQTPARAVDDGPRVDGQVAAVTQREPDEIGVGADVGDRGGTGRTRSTQPNPWMNRGLSTMLTAVPATEPIMDCTAWPSVRSRSTR